MRTHIDIKSKLIKIEKLILINFDFILIYVPELN